MLRKIDKIVGKVTGVICAVSVVACIGIMLLITVDVIRRAIINEAILGGYEIVERLLAVMVFTSFAYTQYKKGHVRMIMLVMHLPKKVEYVIYFVMQLFSAVLVACLCLALTNQIRYSITAKTATAVLFIPMYPFYIIECVAMGIYALTVLWDAFKGISAVFSKDAEKFLLETWDG